MPVPVPLPVPEKSLPKPLNIAEGAGEYATDEKIRFYRMAKRSATECAGILDVCHRLELIGENQYVKGRERLIRIVSILVTVQARPKIWVWRLDFKPGEAEAVAKLHMFDAAGFKVPS